MFAGIFYNDVKSAANSTVLAAWCLATSQLGMFTTVLQPAKLDYCYLQYVVFMFDTAFLEHFCFKDAFVNTLAGP